MKLSLLNISLRKHWKLLLLGGLLLLSFVLKLNNLGHQRLIGVDECCHALVAKNLLKHPFKPTLIETPYLPYAETAWGENHVWLHKPILPLWQIALSYLFLGINTFALRFPSAILSTLAAGLTYLIGKHLLSDRAACIAAATQAFSWFIMQLTHGYMFSDVIDISLLFYCELGIYGLVRLLQTGKWRFVLLTGCGQGLAFLSKTYPAFIITGLTLVVWVLPALGFVKRQDYPLQWKHVLGILLTTLCVATPWMLYTAIQYPIEFKIEHNYIFKHLTENVENWGAPWYKTLIYSAEILNSFLVPVIFALCLSIRHLVQRKQIGLWLLYAWGFGVLIPFLLAVTKTPSATLIGMPAFFLIFGDFAARTTRRKPQEKHRHRLLRIAWSVSLILLFAVEVADAWRVTRWNRNDDAFTEIATFAETQLPENAVLLTEIDELKQKNRVDHLRLMFLTERTAHPYRASNVWKPLSRQIRVNGGIPYLVTFRELDLPILFKSKTDERTIYSINTSE